MNTNSYDLQNCPFCGESAAFVTKSTIGIGRISKIIFTIQCVGCKIQLPKEYHVSFKLNEEGEVIWDLDDRRKALNDWNYRSTEKISQ